MINLLPPIEKDRVYSLLLKKQLHVFVLVIAIIFFGGAIFVLNTLVFLKIQLRELSQSINVEATTEEADQAKSLEDEIKKLNLYLSKYQTFKDESVGVNDIIMKVSNMVPSSTKLTSLNVDVTSKKIILSGQAATRDDIVYMENKIKKAEYFEKMDSPLTNYLQKNNPSFVLSFYFK
ncbi:MAG: hypothetical protein Q8Q90_02590 [bacterium]|nr:hypothetical protein [bacterium]